MEDMRVAHYIFDSNFELYMYKVLETLGMLLIV